MSHRFPAPPRWTDDDIAALLAAGPDERIAFLPASANAARLAETLVALANAHGGMVVFGIAPSGRPQGIADPDEALDTVQAAELLATPPLIIPVPQVVEYADRRVCLIEVPPGLPHAYSLNGRYLTRTGTNNRLLSSAELAGLLLARAEAGFEARPAPDATLADLDMAQVEAYLDRLPGQGGETWQRALQVRGALAHTGDGFVPTYAGVLLFGRQPQRFLRSAHTTLVRYSGPVMGDQFLRQDATGTLPDQIRQAEAFISANMRRGMRLASLTREEATEYPVQVVREAIVNAVAHRDYAIRGDGIRVLMFSDHMEIYSPGRLPGHVTLANLLNERFSRNEAIVQVLADLGFVERLGYGIDRMVSAMIDAGLPNPEFEETVAGFQVVLRGRGEELVSPEQAPRWGNRHLAPRQERALAYVSEHGSITNREFRELFPDLSDETIRRELADMVDSGLLVKIGDRKATYYILK